MNRKGVCYDVGRVMMGSQWRPKFDLKQVHRELEIIKNDLHCNTVRICGLDLKRLEIAAKEALTRGLEVWLSPEMWDRSQEENLPYLEKAAEVAEALRQQFPGKVALSVGSEATLFTQGIVEGENFMQRMNNPSFWMNIQAGKHNKPLNAFLAKACRAVRQTFKGEVTYFSVPFEKVDWSPFDFVGVDLYRDVRIKNVFDKVVKGFLALQQACCNWRVRLLHLPGSRFAWRNRLHRHIWHDERLSWERNYPYPRRLPKCSRSFRRLTVTTFETRVCRQKKLLKSSPHSTPLAWRARSSSRLFLRPPPIMMIQGSIWIWAASAL